MVDCKCFFIKKKERKVRNTSSESSDTCVTSPDLRAKKKEEKTTTQKEKPETGKIQIQKVRQIQKKTKKKKLIAQTCNISGKSSTGTKTVCIFFLIII